MTCGSASNGELKALLVDEPADEQDEPLVGLRERRAQRVEIGDGVQVAAVDAVGDDGHTLLADVAISGSARPSSQ